MKQVWKLWGASIRVQECKAKGLNAAPTCVVKLLVGLRKAPCPFCLSQLSKFQLELYLLKCTYRMQCKKHCNNSKDSLGTLLTMLMCLNQLCVLIPILENICCLHSLLTFLFQHFLQVYGLSFIEHGFSSFKLVIFDINKVLKSIHTEIWA